MLKSATKNMNLFLKSSTEVSYEAQLNEITYLKYCQFFLVVVNKSQVYEMTDYINFGVGINICFPLLFLTPVTLSCLEMHVRIKDFKIKKK